LQLRSAMRASDIDVEAGPATETGTIAPRRPGSPEPEPEPESPLEKAVEAYRPWYRRERRAAARLFAISLATIAASAGLIVWTLSSWPPASRAVRAPDAPAPSAVPDPGQLDPEADETEVPTARLASDDAIGQPIERERVPVTGASQLRGVAAAADGYGVIAAWTDRVVWVSRDDGRSFQQRLAAPEPLTAVAVGPEGRVYAARHGGRVAVLSPAAHTRWLDIGCDEALAISAAPMPAPDDAGARAPWLAVLGLHADSAEGAAPLLWLSGDHGRTWRALVAPHHGDAANRLRVSTDGVIDLVTEDSDTSVAADAGPRFRHYTGHVDGRPFALRAGSDDTPLFGPDHDGQTWQVERRGHATRLALARGAVPTSHRSAPRSLAGLAVRNWDVRLAASRERTLAAADGNLVQLAPGRPRVLTHFMPDDASGGIAVDGLGRALATVGASVVRYSAPHGWRRLFEIPAL
jgi:hypothetical protein